MYQKKTGIMKCNSCTTNEVYFCNQCIPKLQHNPDLGLTVDINSHCGFRIARHEAIFINSEHLETLSDSEDILGTIISSNVVITDKKTSLLVFFEKLAQKMLLDDRWKECVNVRFVLVDKSTFDKAKEFIAGKKIHSTTSSMDIFLNKICKKVEIAQRSVNDPKQAKSFLTEFLLHKDQNYEDFLA
jgi:hypothetical protein